MNASLDAVLQPEIIDREDGGGYVNLYSVDFLSIDIIHAQLI